MDEFKAQKVGYAPIYDDEDPEEVAYQPFAISPIIAASLTSKLQEPAYDNLDIGKNNMIFSAKFRRADSMDANNWSSEFKGKAVRNLIGKQAGLEMGQVKESLKLAGRY